MTTVHARLVGDRALIGRAELERLVELAQRSEPVDLYLDQDDLPTLGIMRVAEAGGAFDYWHEEGEDIYTAAVGP